MKSNGLVLTRFGFYGSFGGELLFWLCLVVHSILEGYYEEECVLIVFQSKEIR